jgi:23S rRNA pseudouridine1911/1915/1917 synthase
VNAPHEPRAARTAGAPRLPILYEDRFLVAIDKPAGLPSVESEGERGRTCVSELRASHPSAQAVHRLDRDVSGVMLFALDAATRVALERLFRERALEKTYLAVVSGVPRPPAGTIRKPIADLGKHARVGGGARGRGRGRSSARAEPAITHYKVVETYPPSGAKDGGVSRGASLVEIDLETGRYNQIRLHFASIGHPLVGERKYARGKDSPVRFRRVALHAWRVTLAHPKTAVPLRIEAPVPGDLERLIDHLSA